jgi:perosamine synthetase
MQSSVTRRHFLKAVSVGAALSSPKRAQNLNSSSQLAILGGKPVRSESFPSWPVVGDEDEKALLRVLRSRKWNRGSAVDQFEKDWAAKVGTPYALATSSGTSALVVALNALEVGPGDEVILPPYTFVATVNAVLLQYALPVFVDTDRETFQIDARRIGAAVTKRTRTIIPVHLGGAAADMDLILQEARARGLRVLEDACQSHLAEWRGRKVGTLGDLGCFSFQASKHLNSGEGGALVGSDAGLIEHCRSFHNQGRGQAETTSFSYTRRGDNRRLTEFQGALLLTQLARLEEQSQVREANARYLCDQLRQISGTTPARVHENCTRNAYHLYMFRYDAEAFQGLTRERFLEALRAEGIPCSGGYAPLNQEPVIKATLESRAYRHIYSAKELAALSERNRCPENDRLCREAVWFSQNTLLGNRTDMDQIAEAVRKIQRHSPQLMKRSGGAEKTSR